MSGFRSTEQCFLKWYSYLGIKVAISSDNTLKNILSGNSPTTLIKNLMLHLTIPNIQKLLYSVCT